MPKAKHAFPVKKVFIILVLVLIVLSVIFLLITKPLVKINPQTPPQLSTQDYSPILVQAAVWYPSAPWSTPAVTTQTTPIGEMKGQFIKATITTPQANVSHFEDPNYLAAQGYTMDNNLSADGPGSSTWGYSKTTNGETDILLFSYSVQPTSSNPNEPLQFNCPCQATITVFSNDTPTPSTTLANPASVNCAQKGGTLIMKTNGTGGEYGLCDFGDNMSCEEWALYRGECPVGGVKTTGYDTIAQKYCAWTGGKTFAVPNSVCSLPDGTKCSTKKHYNGGC